VGEDASLMDDLCKTKYAKATGETSAGVSAVKPLRPTGGVDRIPRESHTCKQEDASSTSRPLGGDGRREK